MAETGKRKAFITGIAGQDGWYVSKLLLEKGYEVFGCGRPGTLLGPRGEELRVLGVRLVEVDLLDRLATLRCVAEMMPQEIYNLAGHSFVPQSWSDPTSAIRSTSWPLIHLLDAVRELGKPIRFFQASSSEIFGLAKEVPQNEDTVLQPANPYAAAKVFSHHLVRLYREHYRLFACCGILYNHESPRRPEHFVTAKVIHAAVSIKAGRARELMLGDLDVARDWGFAGEYAEAMWLILQQSQPQDFIIGTGVVHTVRELCEEAFNAVGLDYRQYVRSDPSLKRPGQPINLLADPSKAASVLGWKAQINFRQLVQMMIEAALKKQTAGTNFD